MDRTYLMDVAKHIKQLGFRVFVTTRATSSYGFFSDGKGVGYFEAMPHIGIRLATKNANGSHCGGYCLSENDEPFVIADLTEELLCKCFRPYPDWVRPLDFLPVVQYKNLDEFLQTYWDKSNLQDVWES